jgi:hypothetical protein
MLQPADQYFVTGNVACSTLRVEDSLFDRRKVRKGAHFPKSRSGENYSSDQPIAHGVDAWFPPDLGRIDAEPTNLYQAGQVRLANPDRYG